MTPAQSAAFQAGSGVTPSTLLTAIAGAVLVLTFVWVMWVTVGSFRAWQDGQLALFDLIWSAGALYFLGVTKGLMAWRPALAKGGVVAFSEPCFFNDHPSDKARAFWEGYDTTDAEGIAAQIEAAGYSLLARKHVSDAAWESYYQPLQVRIDHLRPEADAALAAVLDAAQTEIDTWRAVKDETGYLLCVVQPE